MIPAERTHWVKTVASNHKNFDGVHVVGTHCQYDENCGLD